MAAKDAAALSRQATAAAVVGRSQPDACPASTCPPAGSAHTLHIEYSVWSGSYRIIHTMPDGRRQVWRRGVETLEEARLRARIVAGICGYEAHL